MMFSRRLNANKWLRGSLLFIVFASCISISLFPAFAQSTDFARKTLLTPISSFGGIRTYVHWNEQTCARSIDIYAYVYSKKIAETIISDETLRTAFAPIFIYGPRVGRDGAFGCEFKWRDFDERRNISSLNMLEINLHLYYSTTSLIRAKLSRRMGANRNVLSVVDSSTVREGQRPFRSLLSESPLKDAALPALELLWSQGSINNGNRERGLQMIRDLGPSFVHFLTQIENPLVHMEDIEAARQFPFLLNLAYLD